MRSDRPARRAACKQAITARSNRADNGAVAGRARVFRRRIQSTVATIVAATLLLLGLAGPTRQAHALPLDVGLGAAESFSVLSGADVVSTGATDISANLGGSAISIVAPGVVRGATHLGDAAWSNALVDVADAYNDAAGRTSTTAVTGDLGGRTIARGVYHSAAALALTGTLTLDAEQDKDAVFIFQVAGALDTAASSKINLVNGASAANVFWQVIGAVGIGSSGSFSGNILTSAAITIGAGATLTGRALSTDGTVTLSGNTIVTPPIVTITGASTAFTDDTTPTIAGTSEGAVIVTFAGQTLNPAVGADGAWSVTAAAVPPGSYSVVASVTAAAGYTTTARQTLVVGSLTPVPLGRAASFSVLAGAALTNSGTTQLSTAGDLGAATAPAAPSGIVMAVGRQSYFGDVPPGDAIWTRARLDTAIAYNDAAGRAPAVEVAGDLNGLTLAPGVYHSSAALSLTGTLTLDGQNMPDSVFIFQFAAAFDTAASSTIALTNGASASNVFWQVVGAVGIGGSSSFSGTILTPSAITVGANATLTGRALSSAGAITLASNTVTTANAAEGTLSIGVPTGPVVLGNVAVLPGGERTVSGLLGVVRVDDNRGGSYNAGWVVTVSSTAFTSPSISSIAASEVGYSPGAVSQIWGDVAIALAHPGDLTTPVPAVTASNASGHNAAAATWTPTIAIDIPTSALAGIYTGTVTHSVL